MQAQHLIYQYKLTIQKINTTMKLGDKLFIGAINFSKHKGMNPTKVENQAYQE